MTLPPGIGTDSPAAAPYPSPVIVGSRRLTGPNLYHSRPGAVLEVRLNHADTEIETWTRLTHDLLSRVGWQHEAIVTRVSPSGLGAGLFISAPLDGLMAATELNEQAWLATEAAIAGAPIDLRDVAARLRVQIQHDRQPRLSLLVAAARTHDLPITIDDEFLGVGSGAGSCVWRLNALPDPDTVPWSTLHNIPVCLVTGSNGKTTTTRLIAAMLHRQGHHAGWSCTDGVWVGEDRVVDGDYSGPAGARLVLRDPRVSAAALETARGGILRRGLAAHGARVAVVTSVAEDHLGDYGVEDLEALTQVKLVVERALLPNGHLVLNADDPRLLRAGRARSGFVSWFSLLGDSGDRQLVSPTSDLWMLDGTQLVHRTTRGSQPLCSATELPISLGGTLVYNVANALAASAAASALGVSLDAIRDVLGKFGSRETDNPGRLAVFSLNGARIIADFVHNPDGWNALARGFAPFDGRRIVVVGQAGDRDDAALDALARAVMQLRPSIVILKEMVGFLRGRTLGEISDILAVTFRQLGVSDDALVRTPDERTAVDHAIELMRPGDLVLLAIHDDFDAAVDRLVERGAVRALNR